MWPSRGGGCSLGRQGVQAHRGNQRQQISDPRSTRYLSVTYNNRPVVLAVVTGATTGDQLAHCKPGVWRAALPCGTGESAVIPTPILIVTMLKFIAHPLVTIGQYPTASFVDLKFIMNYVYRGRLLFPFEV